MCLYRFLIEFCNYSKIHADDTVIRFDFNEYLTDDEKKDIAIYRFAYVMGLL